MKKQTHGSAEQTNNEPNAPLFLAAPLISPISVGHRRQSGKTNRERINDKNMERTVNREQEQGFSCKFTADIISLRRRKRNNDPNHNKGFL